MARLDELDLDDESEEENVSLEERVKAQGGSSSAAKPVGDKGDGEDSGKEDGEGEEEKSVADPRGPLGGGDDKPKRHRPRFTEDHIIGANGASVASMVCLCASC